MEKFKITFKIEKVLNNVVKAYLNRVNGKMQKIIVGEYNNQVFITTDGFAGYIVPKSMCPLDIAQIMKDTNFNVKMFFEEESSEGYKDAVMCPELIVNNEKGKKYTLAKFQQVGTDKPECCYVNTKFLEYFDTSNVTYRVANGIKALKVYENGFFIAYILPVRMDVK